MSRQICAFNVGIVMLVAALTLGGGCHKQAPSEKARQPETGTAGDSSGAKAAARPTLEQIVGRYSRQEIFCLDFGDEHRFKLKDGSVRTIRLVSVAEQRDSVIQRMRRAEVDVTIDGRLSVGTGPVYFEVDFPCGGR